MMNRDRSQKLVNLALKNANKTENRKSNLQRAESPLPPGAEETWELCKFILDDSIESNSDIDTSTTAKSTDGLNLEVTPANDSLLHLNQTSDLQVIIELESDNNHQNTENEGNIPNSVISEVLEATLTLNKATSPEQSVDVEPRTEPISASVNSESETADTPQLSDVSSYESSAESPASNTSTLRKGRKRERNYNDWKDVKRKCLKNLGKAYMSKKGASREAKTIKPPCSATCRLKCYEKYDQEARDKIFKQFWDIGDHSRQWDYIVKNTKISDTVHPTKSNSRRKKTIKYYLPCIENDGVPIQNSVCKTMFLNTLAIGERTVLTAAAKWCASGGSVSPDRRGGQRGTPKIDEDVIQGVIRHVNSFQPVESHYVRKNSSRLYLDSDLTFTKMFSLYVQWSASQELTKVATTVRQYRDIVNKHMNIGFHKPKKDICDQCHTFDTNKDNLSTEDQQKHEQHVKNKKIARELKTNDKKESIESMGKIITACFDFQKILNCPHGNVGLFYYKRKLSVLNFTVFDVASHEAFCYMWPEINGKHGASEVASCLYKFIEKKVTDGATEFRFWSDNCPGQNRNRILFCFYTYAARKFGVTITHRFLERGHTQNEADSVHALIERNSKNKLIYTPEQWYALVRWAKTTLPSYNVIEMSITDFYDYRKLLTGKNWTKNTKKEKVTWSRIKEVIVTHDQSNIICYRCDLENERSLTVIVGKTHVSRRCREQPLEILELSHNQPLPITGAKYADLISLCRARIVPQEYHSFFNSLPNNNTNNNATQSDESSGQED